MGIIDAAVKVTAAAGRAATNVADDAAVAAPKFVPKVAPPRAELPAAALDTQAAAGAAATSAAKPSLLEELQAMSAARALRPTVSGPPVAELVSKVNHMARITGRSAEDVRVAIHSVKDAGKFGGAARNPDVFLDPRSGELYPRLSGNAAGPDSMGNLFDLLGR